MVSESKEKQYLDNAYTTSFQATVVACDALPNGHFFVVLDSTFFYPESGGQLSDRGKIADADVVDVREDDSGRVVHEVTAQVDGEVECEVDWDVRFDHMQQHTSQHLLTRAFLEIAGLPTVSFHMGDETCTIDLKGQEPDDEILDAAESLANAIIWENRNVLIKAVPVDGIEEGALRKSLPSGVTEARLVEIEDFDVVACCGTHVNMTGELGAIKIIKLEKVKNNFRLYYKAGRRALWDYQDKHNVIAALSHRFTTSIDGILDKMEKLANDTRRLHRELQKNTKRLVALDKEQILKMARQNRGKRFAVHMCEEGDEGYLNLLASACKSESDVIAILGSKDGSVVCASSPDLTVDLAAVVVAKAKEVGGKSGGKGGYAKASLPSSIDVKEFLEKVYDHVKDTM